MCRCVTQTHRCVRSVPVEKTLSVVGISDSCSCCFVVFLFSFLLFSFSPSLSLSHLLIYYSFM